MVERIIEDVGDGLVRMEFEASMCSRTVGIAVGWFATAWAHSVDVVVRDSVPFAS